MKVGLEVGFEGWNGKVVYTKYVGEGGFFNSEIT